MAGVETVEVNDERYPKALKEALGNLQTSLGPKKLYCRGNSALLEQENCLAVVGSRHLTTYGRKATEQIITQVAAAGVVIVSGFMYGGDEAAHSAAVKAGGRTIAVMPCGIDLIHPPSQKKLYADILKTGGLVISEYEGGLQPQTWMYVQRDRLVAGLSKAVLVTEAALESGSLITAGYAKKYGRKIFAFPGQITSELAKGTTKLIKEGAEPVMEASDILNFFKITVKETYRGPTPANLQGSDPCIIPDSLEQKILEYLRREPMKADDMARALCVSAANLGTTLSLMQLKGFINLDNGKYYVN